MANRWSGISLKDVVDFCLNSDSCSYDSSVGALSSDEEDCIDDLLLNKDVEDTERWVKFFPGYNLAS